MLRIRPFVLALFTMLATPWCLAAEPPSPDVNQLVLDVVKQRMEGDRAQLTLWMPAEFFIAANASKHPDPSSVNEIRRMLDGYAVFLVLDGHMRALATVEATPRDELMPALRLQLSDGTSLAPIPDAELPRQLRTLADVFRPLLRNMLGAFGESVEVFSFKVTKDQAALISPNQEGSFKLMIRDDAFSYRLPLAGLMPPMFDGASGERFPGNFKFNPYTGQKLQAR